MQGRETPTHRGRRQRLWIGAALAAIACTLWAASATAGLTIRGDGRWSEHPECPDGWHERVVAADGWQNIPFPWMHIWPVDWPADPEARPFWGSAIRHRTCVRREFQLATVPTEAAIAHVWADDDYEFYLNGVFIGASADAAAELPGESYDVTAHLRPGSNTIALRLIDVGGVMGALFSLRVPGAEPEDTRFADILRASTPFVRIGLIGVLLLLWGAAVQAARRRCEGAVLRLTSESLALRAMLSAAICQIVLMTFTFYSGEREIPVLDWRLTSLALLGLTTISLAVYAHPLATLQRDYAPIPRRRWILLAIVLLALGLRTAWLDTIPVGFFQDEATNGNDALTFGRAENWLLWSDSVGGRPTLFLYILYVVLEVFGVSYLSLKIAPVAIGTATVAAVYAFGRVAFGARVALWAAFLLAVSRWHIHYSRMAWEAICLPLFAVIGFGLLLYGLKRERYARAALVASAATLSIGLYTYAAYRAVPAVVVVFLAISVLAGNRRVVLRRLPTLVVCALVAIAIAAPLLHFAWNEPEQYWARYREVSLTSYMAYYATPLPWIEQIGRSALALNNVGDEIVRHNLPYWPHLDPFTGALFLLGSALAFWRRQRLGERFVLIWLLVFLALAALTRDGPHATRLLGLAPVCALLAAIAVDALASALVPRLGARRCRLAGGLLALAILLANSHAYFVVAPAHPWAEAEFNATGRSVCEYLRRQQDVDVYWSDDVAFWSDGQCFFLARGRYTDPQPITIDDVVAGGRLNEVSKATVVVLGKEFFDRHEQDFAPGALQDSITLPAFPQIEYNQQGELLYKLYHYGDAARVE